MRLPYLEQDRMNRMRKTRNNLLDSRSEPSDAALRRLMAATHATAVLRRREMQDAFRKQLAAGIHAAAERHREAARPAR